MATVQTQTAPCREIRLDESVLTMSSFEAKTTSRLQALLDETIDETILAELSLEPVEAQIPQPRYNDTKQSQAIISETVVPEETEAKEIQRIDSGVDLTKSVQRALIITPDRTYKLVDDFPVPHDVAPGEVMIRNYATGLNHIDWKSVEYNFCLPELPWVTGREMAGVVEAVGSEVTGYQKGDRVWTSTYYKDRRAGCFQDLVVVPQHTVCPIPSNLDFAAAACLGVGGLTAAMSLWRWLDVPMYPPTDAKQQPQSTDEATDKDCILIWGGSTVTGQFAIQMAAHAGLDVIAVCSARTEDLVRRLKPKHVVTYTGKTDEELVQEIRALGQKRISKAVDLVGPETSKLVLDVIAEDGEEVVVNFAPLAFMSSKQAVPENARVHNVEMKQFVLDEKSEVYARRLNELVESGAVVMPRLRVMEGGLAVVEEGLRRLQKGDLAGEKLVVSFTS